MRSMLIYLTILIFFKKNCHQRVGLLFSMLFLVNLLEIEFYQKCVGPRPFTLTCRRRTTVSGWPSRPNKTHLFTRHFSAVHTVLQPIKDGAERVRRQMLLAWRHQLDHILVHLFHSGGSRHRSQHTPTGDEQQRRTPHVWKKNWRDEKWMNLREKSSLRWRLRRARGSSAGRLNSRVCLTG